MENASKALIIAGAILLAILIIGLGIFIYRQAANTVSDTGMDQLAIQQFNGQFENYLDREISGASARALYDTIRNNNGTAESSDLRVTLYVNGDLALNGETGEVVLSKSCIIDASKYSAYEKLETRTRQRLGHFYTKKNGRINEIWLDTVS